MKQLFFGFKEKCIQIINRGKKGLMIHLIYIYFYCPLKLKYGEDNDIFLIRLF